MALDNYVNKRNEVNVSRPTLSLFSCQRNVCLTPRPQLKVLEPLALTNYTTQEICDLYQLPKIYAAVTHLLIAQPMLNGPHI